MILGGGGVTARGRNHRIGVRVAQTGAKAGGTGGAGVYLPADCGSGGVFV